MGAPPGGRDMIPPRDTWHSRSEGRAAPEDLAFARSHLPQVSRTFARAIEVLPPSLREPVRLSYLLCRVADTMEDAAGVSPAIRRRWLLRFSTCLSYETWSGGGRVAEDPMIGGEDDAPGGDRPGGQDHGDAAPPCVGLATEIAGTIRSDGPERDLIEGLPILFRLLRATERRRRTIIARWTGELALGMARFVRLEEEHDGGWTSLATFEDLDAYEYYVAGTVGCLLEEMIALEIRSDESPARARRRKLAVPFGLGLQGTNILQDMSDDRARGWSYIPEEVAARHGTSTAALHEQSQRDAAVEVVREMAERALGHLDSGIEFVLLLPRGRPRIRLFCLWPLLLAIRTLTRLVGDESMLLRRLRISREEVHDLTREATWRCMSNSALRRLYDRERTALRAAIDASAGARRR